MSDIGLCALRLAYFIKRLDATPAMCFDFAPFGIKRSVVTFLPFSDNLQRQCCAAVCVSSIPHAALDLRLLATLQVEAFTSQYAGQSVIRIRFCRTLILSYQCRKSTIITANCLISFLPTMLDQTSAARQANVLGNDHREALLAHFIASWRLGEIAAGLGFAVHG